MYLDHKAKIIEIFKNEPFIYINKSGSSSSDNTYYPLKNAPFKFKKIEKG